MCIAISGHGDPNELRQVTVNTGTHRYDIPSDINEETTNLISTILED
ncbi:hypothetical protein ACL1HT_09455 [Corynebacterium striatum]|nr:hypothetical protein [Corynebacterium striatum]HAT1175882.1 hypothetical protein [Corynebacterium striatum]HAT1183333.1 hypothetical protein [Corynebacterium striatum]HAT1263565.1 hypothetical protein [Corynebacterium striatum]HAT1327292.1 hypothetical protein [Corynebacterium striatum]